MIDRLRKMFRGRDPTEALISAYLDAPSDTELEGVEERLRAEGVDVDELRTVRETSQVLRSIDTVEAPRSFALTPETLADQGYSDDEAEKILHPDTRRRGIGLRGVLVAGSLVAVVVAVIGVATLTIGDITEYSTETIEQVYVESEESRAESAPAAPGAFADAVHESAEIEEEAVEVVVAGEKAVERAVQRDVQTVEVEKIVEVEMEVVKEVEVLPTPSIARVAMDDSPVMMTDDAIEEPTPTPTEIPCAIPPTPTPTPDGPTAASTAAESIATMSPIPACTPTPTPSPTPTPTPTP